MLTASSPAAASHESPELRYGETRTQADCSAQPLIRSYGSDARPWMSCFRAGDAYLVRFQDVADFIIDPEGRSVTVHALPDTHARTIEHLFQNQALPLALSLQRVLVLHGSAVEIDHRAVAFVGASRRGKSTLAASFASRGFRFLTDDGLHLEKSNCRYVIRPSCSAIRLWEDSRQAVTRGPATTSLQAEAGDKARLLGGDDLPFCADSRVLQRVFFLGDGSASTVSIEPVAGQSAILQLIRHCFLLGVDEREMLAHNFGQLADLSRLPVFFALDYPRRFEVLDEVRAAVIEQCRLDSAPGREH